MKTIKLISLLVILHFYSGTLTSQEPPIPFLNNITIPPSPTATSLGIYGEYEVALSNGLPQISIPLFDIKSRDISLPISVSYHASGIRVQLEASWVGLGWSLNAGGMITRSVKGLDDFMPNGYYGNYESIMLMCNPSNPNRRESLRNVADGLWDSEPDIFYFNVNGMTGRFVFLNDTAFIIPNNNDITIIRNVTAGSSHYEWVLKSRDGTSYIFGGSDDYCGNVSVETVCAGDEVSTLPNIVNEFYLRKIISPNGNEIAFNYSQKINLGQGYNQTTTKSIYDGFAPGLSICKSTSNYLSRKIERIDFNNGYLTFNRSHNRLDVTDGNQALTSIELFSLNNELVKKYSFDYSYFGSTNSKINCRLKLISIVQQSASNESLPPTVFEYNETISMPPKDSKAQDYWGYYNGQGNDQSLIPRTYGGLFDDEGIRDPSQEHMQTGILQKITYPTGGFTEFTFESHDFPVEKDELITHLASAESVSTSGSTQETITDNETFDIEYTQQVIINWEKSTPTQSTNKTICKIYNINTPQVSIWEANEEEDPSPSYVILTPGLYCIETIIALEWPEPLTASADVTYFTKTGNTFIENTLVGGLRIKKIISKNTPNSEGDIVNEYIYKTSINTDTSSGYCTFHQDYDWWLGSHQYNSGVSVPIYTHSLCRVENSFGTSRTSSNQALLGSSGSPMAYSKVFVKKGLLGNNGYELFAFVKRFDVGGNVFTPTTSFSWYRGLEKTHAYYDNNNKLVSKSENFYNTNELLFNRTLKGFPVRYYLKDGCDNEDNNIYIENSYSFISEWVYKDSMVVTNYYGDNNISKSKTFIYDQTGKHHNPVVIKEWDNNELLRETRYKYPQEYSQCNNPIDEAGYAITKMVTKHIFDQPVEKLVFKNGKCVDGELFMFNLWDDDPSNTMTEKFIAPWKVLSLDLLSPANCTFSYIQNNNTFVYNPDYSEKIIFDEYDNFGNILQYHKIDDITVSFQWGYNNELMVARGENTNWNELLFDPETGNLTCPDDALVTTFTHLPNIGLQSVEDISRKKTTYIYDSFNRLKTILDNEGNILQHYEYHYKE